MATNLGTIIYKWCLNPTESARVALSKVINEIIRLSATDEIINKKIEDLDKELQAASNNTCSLQVLSRPNEGTENIFGYNHNCTTYFNVIKIKDNEQEAIFLMDHSPIQSETKNNDNSEVSSNKDNSVQINKEKNIVSTSTETCQHLYIDENDKSECICTLTGLLCTTTNCEYSEFIKGSRADDPTVVFSLKKTDSSCPDSCACGGCEYFTRYVYVNDGAPFNGNCNIDPEKRKEVNSSYSVCDNYSRINIRTMSESELIDIFVSLLMDNVTDSVDTLYKDAFDYDKTLAIDFWNAFLKLDQSLLNKYGFKLFNEASSHAGLKLVPTYICNMLPKDFYINAITIDGIPTKLSRLSKHATMSSNPFMTTILI